jgi:hypothetical protein
MQLFPQEQVIRAVAGGVPAPRGVGNIVTVAEAVDVRTKISIKKISKNFIFLII